MGIEDKLRQTKEAVDQVSKEVFADEEEREERVNNDINRSGYLSATLDIIHTFSFKRHTKTEEEVIKEIAKIAYDALDMLGRRYHQEDNLKNCLDQYLDILDNFGEEK